jgi:hypothetical protein
MMKAEAARGYLFPERLLIHDRIQCTAEPQTSSHQLVR